MRMVYDHVQFIERDTEAKRITKVVGCFATNSTTLLGIVKWWAHWRRYCFFPERYMLFDCNCLWDIADFVAGQTTAQKEIQKQRKTKL